MLPCHLLGAVQWPRMQASQVCGGWPGVRLYRGSQLLVLLLVLLLQVLLLLLVLLLPLLVLLPLLCLELVLVTPLSP